MVFLFPQVSVARYFSNELLAQRIDGAQSNSMQSSGYMVSRILLGSPTHSYYSHYHFKLRYSEAIHLGWDARPIIPNTHLVAFPQRDPDMVTSSSKSLIYRVVHDLVDKMMQGF
jgi:hypothetical protein